jgi:hypothetical protein
MLDDWTIGILFEAFGHIYFRKVDLCGVLSAGTGRRPQGAAAGAAGKRLASSSSAAAPTAK